MAIFKKIIPKKNIPPPKVTPTTSNFDHSVGYKSNPNYNVFDKTTQDVYSNQYTMGDDGFINFAGGVRMEAAGISQNDIDGLSKFYADSANSRNLFHEKHNDSVNESKRIQSQNVSWDNWSDMANAEKLSLFKKMYGDTAINDYDMLDGSELMGNGDGGKLSAINVSLNNMRGGQSTSFDPRDSDSLYTALNKGAIFGSQSAQFQQTPPPQQPKISSMFGGSQGTQQTPQQPKISSIFGGVNKQQTQPSSGFRSLQMFNKPPAPKPSLGGGMPLQPPQGLKQMPMANPRRNLIPRPINPGYKMM